MTYPWQSSNFTKLKLIEWQQRFTFAIDYYENTLEHDHIWQDKQKANQRAKTNCPPRLPLDEISPDILEGEKTQKTSAPHFKTNWQNIAQPSIQQPTRQELYQRLREQADPVADDPNEIEIQKYIQSLQGERKFSLEESDKWYSLWESDPSILIMKVLKNSFNGWLTEHLAWLTNEAKSAILPYLKDLREYQQTGIFKVSMVANCLQAAKVLPQGLYTPLHIMIWQQDERQLLNILDELKKSLSSVDLQNFLEQPTPCRGFTALHLGVLSRKASICKILLDYGSNINAKDILNNNALHLCALMNNNEITTLLQDRSIDREHLNIYRAKASDYFNALLKPEESQTNEFGFTKISHNKIDYSFLFEFLMVAEPEELKELKFLADDPKFHNLVNTPPKIELRNNPKLGGVGVYATNDIAANEYIGDYAGLLTVGYLDGIPGNVYIMRSHLDITRVKRDFWIDGAIFGSYMTRANSSATKQGANVTIYGSTHWHKGLPHVVIVANQPIKKGKQILLFYADGLYKAKLLKNLLPLEDMQPEVADI